MKAIPVAILTVMLAGCGGGGDDGDVVCRTNYGYYGDTTTCNFNDPAPASNSAPQSNPGAGIPGAGSSATGEVTAVTTTPVTPAPASTTTAQAAAPVSSSGTQPQGYRTSF